jgi:hypothetical protein
MMKTTAHLHRPPLAAPPSPDHVDRPAPFGRVRPATVRIGIALSVMAALVTAVLDLPVVAILVPVVVIGFVLSWITCGRPLSESGSRDDVTSGSPG